MRPYNTTCLLFHPSFRIFNLIFQSSFFYAGEKGGGFEAEEFGGPSGVLDIAAGLPQPQFNLILFAGLHAPFDENLLSYEASTLGMSEKKESEEKSLNGTYTRPFNG